MYLDHQDLLAREASPVHPAITALMDFQVIQDPEAAKDRQADPEALDCLDLKDLLVTKERKETADWQVRSAQEIERFIRAI